MQRRDRSAPCSWRGERSCAAGLQRGQHHPESASIWKVRNTLPAEPQSLWIVATGVDQFDSGQHVFGPLSNAAKDARDFAAALSEEAVGLFGAVRIRPMDAPRRLITDAAATREAILARLDEVAAEAKPQDTVVWFFASHRTLDSGGRFAVVPHDIRCSDSNCSAFDHLVNSEDLFGRIQRVAAQRQLLILDTCHAGAIDNTVSDLYDARLSVLARSTGLHVFAAAQATELASDGEASGNGLFTGQILAGLRDRSADENADGLLSSAELGRYARSRLVNSTPNAADRSAIRIFAGAQSNTGAKGRRQTPALLLVGRDFGLVRFGPDRTQRDNAPHQR